MDSLNHEAELISMVRSGDVSSYEPLFEAYQGKIYNFVYGLLGNTEDAKDVTQEAFIKVFEALPRIEKELNFSAYLYRTAHNLAIDELKSKKRFTSPEAFDVEDTSIYVDPERAALLKEQQAKTRNAVADLSEGFRAVLALRELQELSYDEIASVLQIPKNSVGVILSRARLKLKGAFRMSHVDVDKLSKECKKMLPLLSGFVDNELTEEDRARVEKHLEDCPLCRLALEEMTEASKSYRGLIPLLPPLALKADLFSKISKILQLSKTSVSEGAPSESAGTVETPDAPGSAQSAESAGSPESAGSQGSPEFAESTMKTTEMQVSPESVPQEDGSELLTSDAAEQETKALASKKVSVTQRAVEIVRQLPPVKKALLVASLVLCIGLVAGVFYGLTALGGSSKNPKSIAGQPKTKAAAKPSGKTSKSDGTSPTEVTTETPSEAATDEQTEERKQDTADDPEESTPEEDQSQDDQGAEETPEENPDQGTPDEATQGDVDAPLAPTLLSPADDSLLKSSGVRLRWSEVTDPSGVTYTVEIQYFAGGGEGYHALTTAGGLTSTYYSHTVGDLGERWRVWAVDGAGNASSKTEWWNMTKMAEEEGGQTSPDY